MNLPGIFIARPVATTLLTIGLFLAGLIAFQVLPVSPLPQVDFPTISVSAGLPGADPETMATAVAAPLERQFGRIAGVTEMTSTSYRGSTSVTLQFDLNRDINGAARDVQAAINAARSYLPANLPSNPNYRKVNPADAPIIILALTSETVGRTKMYDIASTVLQQKLSQVEGVGQVFVGGGSLPAVRVEVNPLALSRYGISLEDLRGVLTRTNANRPKGKLSGDESSWEIDTTDQLRTAAEYQPLVVSYRAGNAVRLADVASVVDSVEDVRTTGLVNGKPAVMIVLFRQPGANIIETVDSVRAMIPQMEASLPENVAMSVVMDRTPSIRGSLRDVEMTLLVSCVLVILVVFVFLRNVRATVIPAVAVVVSLVGTFGVMYLLGYSLDNLSLMAMTIATGFVVDDAIVVLENITSHIERGESPLAASLAGAKEIAFTVVSMSISLVAVFIPILLMSGMVGRLFREFAVVLSTAVLVSLVLSLTTTPMMCAALLRPQMHYRHGRLYGLSERGFAWVHGRYEGSLRWALRHSRIMALIMLATVATSVYLYAIVPKGFFPEQDTGRLAGNIQAAQDISFQAMRDKLAQVVDVIKSDPEVEYVTAFTGGGGGGGSTTNTGRMFIALKPFDKRTTTVGAVIGRLRPKLAQIPGAPTFLQPVQDLRVGGRMSNALYQYTLQAESFPELAAWAPRMVARMRTLPGIVDVNSDQQDKGLQASLVIDRDGAARFGITPQTIDNILYDAFGQRQVSINYTLLNQYHVVMEVDPAFWQRPESLRSIYVPASPPSSGTTLGAGGSGGVSGSTTKTGSSAVTGSATGVAGASGTGLSAGLPTGPSSGLMVPLSAITRYETRPTTLSVNHQGQFPAVTISFNLTPGTSLGTAVAEVEAATRELGMPASVRGSFQGTAQAFQASLANQTLLILAALVTVYIVLGVLYESYIHPVTILSTLPSAGVGAVLAMLLFKTDLSVIAVIGIILLIGLVKKNGIMMVDFALAAERGDGKSPEEAIFQASLLRFRPIMMTTMAALLGALPLALGVGVGSELRRPLGIAIIGGLVFSQALTLYTTPVVYLYLDRFRLWIAGFRIGRKRRKRRKTT